MAVNSGNHYEQLSMIKGNDRQWLMMMDSDGLRWCEFHKMKGGNKYEFFFFFNDR